MVLLNQNQLLGGIIPDVLISKITLETAGGSPPLKENNPHIDLEKTPPKFVDPITGKLTTPKIRPNVILKNISSQAIDPVPSEKLIVTLDLILKEKLDNGLIGTWFKNKDFGKYLRLKVIQSTAPELTNAASGNKNLLFAMAKDNVVPLSTGLLNTNLRLLSEHLNSNDVQDTLRILHSSIEERTLNVHSDIIGDKTNLTQHYTEVDNDGNTITSFVFRTKFELNNQNPEHLSYFAFSYLDLFQLAKDFKMKLDSKLISEPYGKAVSEIVFDNGETVGESFVYLDDTGALWVGSIDETVDGNAFGLTKDGTKIPITRSLVGNSTLQDFRHFKDIERLFLDFSVIDNEILNIKLDGPRKDKLDISTDDSFFSDFYLSKDDNGNVRFYFSLNMRKILAKNALFGKLFSNPKTGKLAIFDSSIVSMKILRRRVMGSPEIGSGVDISHLFDDNQIDELISISGEKNYKGFLEKNDEISSLREINDISVQGIEGPQDLSDVRNFTGVDKTADDVTDGYFVYGIELEIEDSSVDFLKNRLRQLRTARLDLDDYLSRGTRLDSDSTLVSNNNPHIDFPGETKLDQTTHIPGNFNTLLNRFSQKFIDEQIQIYGKSEDSITPWGTAVAIYIDMLKLFVPDTSNIPFDKFTKSLLFFVHPATGNPSGILKVSKLMETLESTLSKVVGDIPSPNTFSSTAAQSAAIGSKSPTKIFKLSKFFTSVFDSNISKTIGYDFLDIATNQDQKNGLKVISGEEYAERVERETNHYYVQPNNQKPDINIKTKDQEFTKSDSINNTSFSYLTPAKINFSDKFSVTRLGHSPTPFMNKTTLAHLDLSIKSFNVNPLPIKTQNFAKLKSNTDKPFQEVSHDVIKILAAANVQPVLKMNQVKVPLPSVVKDPVPFKRPLVNIDPLMEDNSSCTVTKDEPQKIESHTNPTPVLLELARRLDTKKPANSPITHKNTLSFSSNKQLIKGKPLSIRMFDLNSPSSLLHQTVQDNSFRSVKFIQGVPHKNVTLEHAVMQLPNQIKSLYVSRTTPTVIRNNVFQKPTDPIRDPEEKSEFRLNYQMINSVQVFNGYQTSVDGELLLKNPLWVPLTLSIYNESIGKDLLCRLKPYENNIIGVVRDASLELPIYDEYFIIRPQKDAAGIQTPEVAKPPVLTVLPPPQKGKKIETPTIEIIKKENAKQLNVRSEYIQTNVVNNNVAKPTIGKSNLPVKKTEPPKKPAPVPPSRYRGIK